MPKPLTTTPTLTTRATQAPTQSMTSQTPSDTYTERHENIVVDVIVNVTETIKAGKEKFDWNYIVPMIVVAIICVVALTG